MEYFKSEVMEMCHRENLYQIDLLHGSKNRVTEREYWAQKKGQLALDKANAPMIADGITPVSYTHLPIHFACFSRRTDIHVVGISKSSVSKTYAHNQGTVSYTHLDVYKRQ